MVRSENLKCKLRTDTSKPECCVVLVYIWAFWVVSVMGCIAGILFGKYDIKAQTSANIKATLWDTKFLWPGSLRVAIQLYETHVPIFNILLMRIGSHFCSWFMENKKTDSMESENKELRGHWLYAWKIPADGNLNLVVKWFRQELPLLS